MIRLQTETSDDDRLKFEQLYQHYKGLMYHVAYNMLSNNHDAEDAVHQAFLSIYVNLDKIGVLNDNRTKSYVVTITENKAIDILRKRKNQSKGEFDETEHGIEIPMPGDFGLADTLAKLPARYREVLLLRYDNGYSVGEVGKILGINYAAAQKLIWRAKKMLEERLGV